MQSPAVAFRLSLLLVIASVGRVRLQCGTGPIDSLPESIVNVTENEVIGFSCDITSCDEEELKNEDATLCIKHNDSTSSSLYYFLSAPMQHEISMLETLGDGGKKKYVNLRVKTAQFSSGEKDKAFVAHIPSGSIMFCIVGETHKCYSNPVVQGSATKYMVTDDSTTTTICKNNTLLSINCLFINDLLSSKMYFRTYQITHPHDFSYIIRYYSCF